MLSRSATLPQPSTVPPVFTWAWSAPRGPHGGAQRTNRQNSTAKKREAGDEVEKVDMPHSAVPQAFEETASLSTGPLVEPTDAEAEFRALTYDIHWTLKEWDSTAYQNIAQATRDKVKAEVTKFEVASHGTSSRSPEPLTADLEEAAPTIDKARCEQVRRIYRNIVEVYEYFMPSAYSWEVGGKFWGALFAFFQVSCLRSFVAAERSTGQTPAEGRLY
jgi:hypothetical protein